MCKILCLYETDGDLLRFFLYVLSHKIQFLIVTQQNGYSKNV